MREDWGEREMADTTNMEEGPAFITFQIPDVVPAWVRLRAENGGKREKEREKYREGRGGAMREDWGEREMADTTNMEEGPAFITFQIPDVVPAWVRLRAENGGKREKEREKYREGRGLLVGWLLNVPATG